jgi:PAS domain-containing protein
MEEDLRKRETELNESRRVAHIGSWDWDTTTDSITWSPEYYRIYNINPKLPMPNYLDHLKIYTPESAERLDAAVRKAMQTGEPYELELELANQDTGRRWIRNRRRSLKNRSSRPKSSKASECLPAASPTISTTCFRVSLDISQWQN